MVHDLSYIYVSTVILKKHLMLLIWMESFSKPTHLQNVNVKPGETVEVTSRWKQK